MLTRTDIQNLISELKQIFATKDDLNRFASKEDLNSFASKEDLNRFATKDDLNRFASKEDLNSFASKEDLNRFATKDDFSRFATKQDLSRFATKEDFSSLASQVASMAIDLKNVKETVNRIDARDLADSNAFARTAVDHDNRLKRIEKILKIKSPRTA